MPWMPLFDDIKRIMRPLHKTNIEMTLKMSNLAHFEKGGGARGHERGRGGGGPPTFLQDNACYNTWFVKVLLSKLYRPRRITTFSTQYCVYKQKFWNFITGHLIFVATFEKQILFTIDYVKYILWIIWTT